MTKSIIFPNAPDHWSQAKAAQLAEQQGLSLSDEHWEAISSLQEYFSKNIVCSSRRELTDALEEKFHEKGGLKYLYRLFPGGPVAQGCVLSGIAPPSGSIDPSFGSVV